MYETPRDLRELLDALGSMGAEVHGGGPGPGIHNWDDFLHSFQEPCVGVGTVLGSARIFDTVRGRDGVYRVVGSASEPAIKTILYS